MQNGEIFEAEENPIGKDFRAASAKPPKTVSKKHSDLVVGYLNHSETAYKPLIEDAMSTGAMLQKGTPKALCTASGGVQCCTTWFFWSGARAHGVLSRSGL